MTTEYHTNGNYGLIVTNTTDNKRPYARYYSTDIPELLGNTISFSIDVKTTQPLNLVFYWYDHEGSIHASRTNIPSNSEGTFTVSCTLPSDSTGMWIGPEFKDAQLSGSHFYTDNWRLEITQ